MKVFLSYSSDDKESAGRVKINLEVYGLTPFLAHEDIEASEEWRDVILTELENSDVFIPIVTEDFYASHWTDQETGIAVAHGIFIVPIKVSEDPRGLIRHVQAARMRGNNVAACCREVVEAIAKEAVLGEILRDALIEKLGDSWSFGNAADNAERVVSFGGYTPLQVEHPVRT